MYNSCGLFRLEWFGCRIWSVPYLTYSTYKYLRLTTVPYQIEIRFEIKTRKTTGMDLYQFYDHIVLRFRGSCQFTLKDVRLH